LIGALAIVVLIAAGALYVFRQYAGYFSPSGRGHRVVAAASPSPSRRASAAPLSSASPTPLASGATPAPRIAIIIDDCGYNLPRDLRFLRLPIPVTLSILPMTPHGKQVADAAVAAGKAVMLHLPMEPESPTVVPGPGEITTAMTDQQVQAQVAADIASLPPLPGANNHEGSKATSDPRVMRDVLGVLKHDDMFFIDSRTAYSSVGEATAQALEVPTAKRDVFLDDQVSVAYIEGQIKQLATVAAKNGSAIAIGHPNPQTAQALEKMVPQLQAAGFSFVTAQSLVK
jgi:uncharacterized protein